MATVDRAELVEKVMDILRDNWAIDQEPVDYDNLPKIVEQIVDACFGGDVMTKRVRHYHRFVEVGPAEEFQGHPCRLWRCECGATRELFESCEPAKGAWTYLKDGGDQHED